MYRADFSAAGELSAAVVCLLRSFLKIDCVVLGVQIYLDSNYVMKSV